ncbi:hypothetical protein ACTG23_10675 [Aeromonas enteropelogenes]|uniref:hypothetical protein n=1 Tax=Aeromonas enteropelogenes TaxID=29489 RepID=UPI003F7B150F
MTEPKLAKKMIIENGSRRSWQYRLRDLLILLVTWGGWLFLVLQPWFNYLETGEGETSSVRSIWWKLGSCFWLC